MGTQHRERDERYGRLLLRLQQRGISLEEASRLTGLSQPMIRRYGSGEAKPNHSASLLAWEHVLRLADLTLEQFERGDFDCTPPAPICASCDRLRSVIQSACGELLEAGTQIGLGSPAAKRIVDVAKGLLKAASERPAQGTGSSVSVADPGKGRE